MLAKRVIPCMDVKDGRVVKGVNFVNLRDAGDPIELAQRYDEERADEVIFLDITATSDDRATTVDLASRASEQLHLPYCVGGGFRSVADIRTMIAAGADKVSVNSAAVDNPRSSPRPPPHSAARPSSAPSTRSALRARETSGRCTCTADGWPRASTPWPGRRKPPAAGRGRYCSPAWIATAAATASTARSPVPSRGAVDVPVIASGGVGKLEHFAEGVIEGEADAVLAASVFHFGELTVRQVKEHMASQGIPVRL